MATWKQKRADSEITLSMQTINGATRIKIIGNADDGTMFEFGSILIPLETLKELVNAQ